MSDKQSGKANKPCMKRILVPLDGSEFGEAALPCAEELARVSEAEIILMQSVAPHHFEIDLAESRSPHLSKLSEEYVQHATAAARDYLDGIEKRLSQSDIAARSVVEVGAPAEQIIACAKKNAVDIIALSTHGRSGLSALMMGSVANKVLHYAEVPVLLVRPRK
ncbi:MAG TPA: universal stress protein [Dehalococcoidia bacterium]|jgi:nucleotide-binding universal stress UspA family protein|nr:universal stress protein [Dehalococcoidia bacterium]